jgi:hypothetical protein
MVPRIAPEGTTNGASFDLKPPFGQKNHQSKRKAIRQFVQGALPPHARARQRQARYQGYENAFQNRCDENFDFEGFIRREEDSNTSSTPIITPITKATGTLILWLSWSLPGNFPKFNVA